MALIYSNPKILAVEGKDEQNFFEALIHNLGLTDIDVLDICGKTQFKNRLWALVNTSNFSAVTSLGIVRDADNNPTQAFYQICSALRHSQLPVPAAPWVILAGVPNVVIMIMPGPNQQGMIEDLCLSSVATQPEMQCVTGYFNCLATNQITPLNTQALSKAMVQTYLASKPITGLSLGLASFRGYWPFNNAVFNLVKNTLRSL